MKCSECKKEKEMEYVSYLPYGKKNPSFIKLSDVTMLLGKKGMNSLLKNSIITGYCKVCGERAKMVEDL